MVNVNKLFPTKYLRADELDGKSYAVEIREVRVEEIGWGETKEKKPVLYFKGAKKGMVLNRTNAFMIAKLYGRETDGWIGKSIEIYPTTVPAFGEVHDVIRVRHYKPVSRPAAAATNEKSTEDIPY